MAAEDWIDFCEEEDYYIWSEPEYIHDCKVIASTPTAILISHPSYGESWFPCKVAHMGLFGILEYDSWFEPRWRTRGVIAMPAIEGDFE